jgi:hypothetical protein
VLTHRQLHHALGHDPGGLFNNRPARVEREPGLTCAPSLNGLPRAQPDHSAAQARAITLMAQTMVANAISVVSAGAGSPSRGAGIA